MAKLSLGSGSQLMLMQSTVDLNADSTRLIQQLVFLANLQADFNRLLAWDRVSFTIHDTIVSSEIKPLDTIIRLALLQNSQISAARLQQNLARLGVNKAQSDRYPQISLNADYSYNTLNAQTGFLQYNQSFGPSFGITLSYNLFNGFNVNRTIKNAKVMLNSGELEVQDSELILKTSLIKLYNEFNSNRQIVQLQHSNVNVARENVVIAFEKYKLGSINDIELREIQRKLIEAEYQLIASQFEVKKAEIEISRYTGEILNNAVTHCLRKSWHLLVFHLHIS
jgi:outer membrane protein TolC